MERNTERHTLSFSKGVTNVPNDLLSGDNELSECNGFTYKAGSMVPIQAPQKIGNIPEKIMYVHKGAGYENIICYEDAGVEGEQKYDNIAFYKRDGDTFTEIGKGIYPKVTQVSSVGNTVVCSTRDGIYYFLYKENKYNRLKDMPDISASFLLEKLNKIQDKERDYCNLDQIIGIKKKTAWWDANDNFLDISDEQPEGGVNSYTCYWYEKPKSGDVLTSFNNAVQGHVSSAINWVKSKNLFAFPFSVRVALKLFDGSLAKISQPIVLYPSIRRNGRFNNTPTRGISEIEYIADSNPLHFFFFLNYSELLIMLNIPYGYDPDWRDIIREVVIYASEPVLPFRIDGDWNFTDTNKGAICYDSITVNYKHKRVYSKELYAYTMLPVTSKNPYNQLLPKYKTDEEIKKELVANSRFYKIISIDYTDITKYTDTYHHTIETIETYDGIISNTDTIKLPENILTNLTEQEQMKDDYFGNCELIPEGVYPYNNRINLFRIKRVIHDNSFYCNLYGGDTNFIVYIYISSDKQSGWIKAGECCLPDFMLSGYFFFHHPDAKKIMFYNAAKGYIQRSLKVHPYLNGAYTFDKLPSDESVTFESKDLTFTTQDFVEALDSQIYTSVVNNPFVFEASGDNTVGTGKILGIVANTEAVSQGQFGQYPLLIFTSEGVYGMSVNSEGLYSASYPISREVANENSPFVPTDKLVFFTSEKGLMAVSGGSVVCVSEQLRGRDDGKGVAGRFTDFMKDCMIAYDYRDSMLRIFKKGLSVQYVYNMEDKTFSTVSSGIDAQSVVNDYPDNLIQDTDGNVYSLTEKPGINEDVKKYSGTIKTRPLKLGGSMTLKSLRRIKNLVDSKGGAKLSMKIHASNNAANWAELNSLKGKPWSYFIFEYKLEDFYACDAFVGTIVDIQNRRDAK